MVLGLFIHTSFAVQELREKAPTSFLLSVADLPILEI